MSQQFAILSLSANVRSEPLVSALQDRGVGVHIYRDCELGFYHLASMNHALLIVSGSFPEFFQGAAEKEPSYLLVIEIACSIRAFYSLLQIIPRSEERIIPYVIGSLCFTI
jgi:hypothetical protein